MGIDLEVNTTTELSKRGDGIIVHAEGGLGKSTFLVNAVNKSSNGLLVRCGIDGISKLGIPVKMYNRVIGNGDVGEQGVQGWNDFQDVLKAIYLSKKPYDMVAFDELDSLITGDLHSFITDKYYREPDGSLNTVKANAYGGSWLKEAMGEVAKVRKMFIMIQEKGTSIYISMHSQAVTFKHPAQPENYKRMTLDIPSRDDTNIRGLLVGWADYVLYGMLDTIMKDDKPTGDKRILKTKLNSAYDAKQRGNILGSLPETILFDYSVFKSLITSKEKEAK